MKANTYLSVYKIYQNYEQMSTTFRKHNADVLKAFFNVLDSVSSSSVFCH